MSMYKDDISMYMYIYIYTRVCVYIYIYVYIDMCTYINRVYKVGVVRGLDFFSTPWGFRLLGIEGLEHWAFMV